MADRPRDLEAGREFSNTHYRNIATDVYAAIRREGYDEHFGQRTGAEAYGRFAPSSFAALRRSVGWLSVVGFGPADPATAGPY